MIVAVGPYFVSDSVDEELGIKWFMVNGPGIADPKTTATSDHDEAIVHVSIRNEAYTAGRDSRDRLKDALKEAQKFITDQITEIGDCDHSVGHCVCEVLRLSESVERALGADGEGR
jgi:hypothetical protein